MPPPPSSLIVDALGFLTGSVLYAMLLAMVWRERRSEGAPLLSPRGRLPLLTGVFGLIWNLVGLSTFGSRLVAGGPTSPIASAIAFSALGFLPAAVVHALLQGPAAALRSSWRRPGIVVGYALSGVAALMHLTAAVRSHPVPSHAALWMLTGGFGAMTLWLLVLTRAQPTARRGIWVAALAVFAVSALHFSNHGGNEPWWVELAGHHASLPLALAILQQDYRFALADLFLEHAIALLLLMGLSIALLSGVIAPVWEHWPLHDQDPRTVAVIVGLWMLTAMTFPWLRRIAHALVDRIVLRRPDFERTLARCLDAIEAAESEDDVRSAVAAELGAALGVTDLAVLPDPLPDRDARLAVTGLSLRGPQDELLTALVRLRTVDPPQEAIALGPLSGGRRLLSDDLRLLEGIARAASRRIDHLRVACERLARDRRERESERLASEAELRALRARLHPHFLFNALTTIGYLIESSPSRAVETLMRLTQVLRGVLRRSATEFATLGDEIDFICAYLDIERARFEERLTVTIDVDAALRPLACPTLLLQPLVENAIKHGLSPRRAGGRVVIAARRDGGSLTIRVEDDGVGFDAAWPTRAGVGLSAVAQRLHAHFGSLGHLSIASSPGAGCRIEVSMPALMPSILDERRAG